MYKLLAFNRDRACVALMMQSLVKFPNKLLPQIDALYRAYMPISSQDATYLFDPTSVEPWFTHRQSHYQAGVTYDGLSSAVKSLVENCFDEHPKFFLLGVRLPDKDWGHAIGVIGTSTTSDFYLNPQQPDKGHSPQKLEIVVRYLVDQKEAQDDCINLVVWTVQSNLCHQPVPVSENRGQHSDQPDHM